MDCKEIFSFTPHILEVIEHAGRVCYKSENKISPDSAEPFIQRLLDSKHESVIEHGAITCHIICDRGVSHELVRHRIASYSQESTRYCNYNKGCFGSEITVIHPVFLTAGTPAYDAWYYSCLTAESSYQELLAFGHSPQEARSVLPNSLKTEVVITANPRDWRWIFKKRCAKTAHPQMREIMIPLLAQFTSRWPVLFKDIPHD